MLRKSLTHLLIFCYSLPVLLGHGGLHAVFGVEHHCSHHHGVQELVAEAINDEEYVTQFPANADLSRNAGHSSDCCHKHSENPVVEHKQSETPSQPVEDEDDCKLCQHTSQGQIESQNVEVHSFGTLVGLRSTVEHVSEDRYNSSYSPRGPPLFC